MSVHNDGWQKQSSIAANIAERGKQAVKQDANAEKSQASKLLHALQGRSKAPDAASTASTSEAARQLVQPGKDVPQTLQKARPETQDQAARQDQTAIKANKEYVDAKKSSADLQMKVIKTPDTVTTEAVKQKGHADGAHLQTQNPQQPGVNVAANAARQAQTAKTKDAPDAARQPAKGKDAADGKQTLDGRQQLPQTARTQGAEAAGAQAAASTFAMTQAGERPQVAERREGESTEEEGGKKKSGDAKNSTGVYASKSNAGRDLGALLGGSAGGDGFDGHDPQAGEGVALADGAEAAPEGETLLERDTGFRVYNEFDELAPGVEVVRGEAQRFSKFVEKRLVEIAKLDSDLDLAIVSVSQKIVVAPGGDPGLVQAVKDGIFQRKSVYGGLIG